MVIEPQNTCLWWAGEPGMEMTEVYNMLHLLDPKFFTYIKQTMFEP